MCNYAVKKLLYVMWFVPDWGKIQQMFDIENGGTYNLFLTATETNKCAIKLLTNTLMH